MMREKKGGTLGISFLAKIGIAVGCLVLLIYFLNLMYGYYQKEHKKEQAESALIKLRDVMERAKKTGNFEVAYLDGVRDWRLFVSNAKDGKGNVWCAGEKYCLCMCPLPLGHENCIKNKNGVCIEIEKNVWGKKSRVFEGYVVKIPSSITVQYYDRRYEPETGLPNWGEFYQFYDFNINDDFITNYRNDVIEFSKGISSDDDMFSISFRTAGVGSRGIPSASKRREEIDLQYFKDRSLMINEKYSKMVNSVYDVAEGVFSSIIDGNNVKVDVNPNIVMSVLLGKYNLFERDLDKDKMVVKDEPTNLDETGKSYWRDVWTLKQVYDEVQSDALALIGEEETKNNCDKVLIPVFIGQDRMVSLEKNNADLINSIKTLSSVIGKCVSATLKKGYDDKVKPEKWYGSEWDLGDGTMIKPTSKTNGAIYWYLIPNRNVLAKDVLNSAERIWKIYNLYAK